MIYALITLLIVFILFITWSLLRIASPTDRTLDDADQIRFLDDYRRKHSQKS